MTTAPPPTAPEDEPPAWATEPVPDPAGPADPTPAAAALPAAAETALADGFARHLQRWALACGADDARATALAAAARAVSLATSAGHVCLDLGAWTASRTGPDETGAATDAAGRLATWRQWLLGSGLVGTPAQPAAHPLVLDDGHRLYLHRYFDLERRLARRLARAARPLPPPGPGSDAAMAAGLARLFSPGAGGDGRGGAAVDWQRLAAALALHGRLTVISGGPGTGKTTTVVNLLACLLAQQPEARVVLAAPTGKAAARLTEALGQRAGHLDADLRARLPDESFTVHRLLGVRPEGDAHGPDGPFLHHAGHRLALDVLVVDEASMLDLALATRLLEAVPDSARIVLLGDKDQLAAVESGAVFAELSADPSLTEGCRAHLAALCGLAPAQVRPPAPRQPSALADSVVWFDRNFRFRADSGIGRLAADTVAGRADAALAWLRAGGDESVRWLDDSAPAPQTATQAATAAGFAPYFSALAEALAAGAPGPAAIARITAALGQFRVLCAVQQGPRGVAALNQAVGRLLQQALPSAGGAARGDPRSDWFAGRPVMVLRNDPGLRLFNGDIGIALPDAAGALRVWFPTSEGGFRAVAPARLPPHQTAFAMTVHKAQGSEFSEVLVLLPAQRSRVLSRELLYTAITRARQRVWLAGGASVLAAAVASATQRQSGLQDRLQEALAEAGP